MTRVLNYWKVPACVGSILVLLSMGIAAQTNVYEAPENLAQPVVSYSSTKEDTPQVECGNLIYGGSKSSQCFSDKFLSTVRRETNIEPAEKFTSVRLSSEELFKYPFTVMTGEGTFAMLEQERVNLKSYLMRGGFLLASAGCSSEEWNQSFRNEIKKTFPDIKLKKIPMDHKIFSTVFDVRSLRLSKSSGTASLEGLEIDGRIVLVYSPEGLNDTGNVQGCCCCGGNEIQNSQEVNVNVFTYALTH